MTSFDMAQQPSITFGAGRLVEATAMVSALTGGAGPVLLVADAVLIELGHVERLVSTLAADGMGVEVAAEITGEPKETLVDALAERARQTDCRAVIAMGGGAAMDAGKLVAAIAPSGQPAGRFALAANPIPGNRLPAVAIPTTAGTGSEITRTSIVSTTDGKKLWWWSEDLMFAHAILDPELTLTLPPAITAWTGIDAVAHALEAITGRNASPTGMLFGAEALRLLVEFLPKAVADGSDIETRGKVHWASTLAGLALHNCNTHLGHNISHALGSLAPIHHGLATGLALECALPWLIRKPGGADNFAVAANLLGGKSQVDELPLRFSTLMRAVGISPALPEVCAGVSAGALAAEMKSPANRAIADNAPSPVNDTDLDELAGLMLGSRKQAA